MEPQCYGKIINIASIAGLGTDSAFSPVYSASKAAVISYTKTAAFDVAGANIYVNCIACGGVMTPPFKKYLAEASEQEKRNLLVVERAYRPHGGEGGARLQEAA